MSREAWRDFICSDDHAGRHLSSIGRGVIGSTHSSIDLHALQAFLEKLSGANADISLLATVVDLLTGGYLQFLRNGFQRLLFALSNERVAREEIVGPALRGNPKWGATMLRRRVGTLSRVHYVTHTAHRSFDLPENQLLAWFVSDTAQRIKSVEKKVGFRNLHPDLQSISLACREALKHEYFADIQIPSRITHSLILSGQRQKRPEYREAAALARRSELLLMNDPAAWWYNVISLLAVNWLEPVNSDDLFELYILVLTIDVLAKELGFGDPLEYGLVSARRERIAHFATDELTIDLFFDQTPAAMLKIATAYGSIVSDYKELKGAERRPDIMLSIEKDGVSKLILIEVKKTSDDKYASDSVYKMFGYIHDFSSLSGRDVSGILMLPGIVTQPATRSADTKLHIASGNSRADFANVLEAAIRF
ncbi:hypothetical protein [Rhizobium glycinendophyticum]|uniref:Uncharacterized protein n=1 Tax=Rhizobium glycinendophyticum TaxID=2589807 RepID=A0A504UAL4_9HYPH|nr:hypothetical protein [Rhizobium glycinendophyticum]TPP11529.1 hypothetical protein FJQ55_12205 [Rhizobium glycinendophyticum]